MRIPVGWAWLLQHPSLDAVAIDFEPTGNIPALDLFLDDLEILRALAARGDGFSGMIAVHPSQVEAINSAFAPTSEEIAEAREIAGLFALNPGAEALPSRGRYVRQGDLVRARQLLGED